MYILCTFPKKLLENVFNQNEEVNQGIRWVEEPVVAQDLSKSHDSYPWQHTKTACRNKEPRSFELFTHSHPPNFDWFNLSGVEPRCFLSFFLSFPGDSIVHRLWRKELLIMMVGTIICCSHGVFQPGLQVRALKHRQVPCVQSFCVLTHSFKWSRLKGGNKILEFFNKPERKQKKIGKKI